MNTKTIASKLDNKFEIEDPSYLCEYDRRIIDKLNKTIFQSKLGKMNTKTIKSKLEKFEINSDAFDKDFDPDNYTDYLFSISEMLQTIINKIEDGGWEVDYIRKIDNLCSGLFKLNVQQYTK